MTDARSVVAYILSRAGCIHPFRLSRILALAELRALEKMGKRLTDLRYEAGPGAFYIVGFKEEIVEKDPCCNKREGDPSTGRKGCLEYLCEPPEIPEDVRSLIDEVLAETEGVDDFQLNNIVINNKLFKKLVE